MYIIHRQVCVCVRKCMLVYACGDVCMRYVMDVHTCIGVPITHLWYWCDAASIRDGVIQKQRMRDERGCDDERQTRVAMLGRLYMCDVHSVWHIR